jgi:hypothetical protein
VGQHLRLLVLNEPDERAWDLVAERLAATSVRMSIRSSDPIEIAEPMVFDHRSDFRKDPDEVRLEKTRFHFFDHSRCAASAGNAGIQELQEASQRIATRERKA